MGRQARGVKGIRLDKEDYLVGMEAVYPDMELIVVSEKGFGKRTPVSEYRKQSRGGKGIYTAKITSRTGSLVGFRGVHPQDELMIITAKGIVIRQEVKHISRQGRQTQGVTLIRIGEGDRVVSFARVPASNKE